MINVPGSDASFPANVRLPATGDPPTATNLGSQGSDLADRTAWLKARAESVVVTEITAVGSTAYDVPAGCVKIQLVVVAGGQGGFNGAAAIGGHGGQAGEIATAVLTGALPATLSCTVAAGGSTNGGPAQHSWVSSGVTTICFAAGGGTTSGGPSDIAFADDMPSGAWGGTGGAASAGERGATSGTGAGGGGGTSGNPGSRGLGYGAGGGGGRQSSSTSSGGGGGGGGYGVNALADNGAAALGGGGADGVIIITATIDLGAL